MSKKKDKRKDFSFQQRERRKNLGGPRLDFLVHDYPEYGFENNRTY